MVYGRFGQTETSVLGFLLQLHADDAAIRFQLYHIEDRASHEAEVAVHVLEPQAKEELDDVLVEVADDNALGGIIALDLVAIYQIDAWLPDDLPVLLVRVCIWNPHDADVPMYWWSNTAVPEREDVRVIVSADSAYNFGYGEGGPARVDMPVVQGTDVSYP